MPPPASNLGPIDTAFVRMESACTPMHVGGLLEFRLPRVVAAGFVDRLFEAMRDAAPSRPPFNWRLADPQPWALPSWRDAGPVDLRYHVRRCALPEPGGRRELDRLVSRLHSQRMDMSRPLWECHLIEGLRGGRFAIYLKVHHSAVDGMAALRLVRKWLSVDPADVTVAGPWAQGPAPRNETARSGTRPGLRSAFTTTWRRLRAAVELGGMLRHLLRREENPQGGLRSAFETPASMFNAPVTPHRNFASQSFRLGRLQRLAHRTGATINDVALAMCSGALRRYLARHGGLPEQSLVASVPIGLPRPDGKPGNAVAGFVCPLATHEPDARRRLEIIRSVTQRTKDHLHALSPGALEQFTLLGFSPLILGQLTGLSRRLPPIFNLVVSNVVGAREKLYLRGAELEAIYPVSVLFDGYALNLSLVSSAGRLALGFTGCPRIIPDLRALADGTVAALQELEAAFDARPRGRPAAARAGRQASQSISACAPLAH